MRSARVVWPTAILVAATASGLARDDVSGADHHRSVPAAHGPGGAVRPQLDRNPNPRLSPDDVTGAGRDARSAPARVQPDSFRPRQSTRDEEESLPSRSPASQGSNSARPGIRDQPSDGARRVPNARLQSTPAPRRLALGEAREPSSREPAAPPAAWFGGEADDAISTMLGGLAIAVGVFLLLAWAVRKRMPKGSARLPDEIIEVLGRTTLAAKQSLHLVRVGGKLIVVSVTAAGTETLTEITDPGEVARILAACQQHHIHSSATAFRQVFEQLGREPTSGFLGAHSARSHYNREGTGAA